MLAETQTHSNCCLYKGRFGCRHIQREDSIGHDEEWPSEAKETGLRRNHP